MNDLANKVRDGHDLIFKGFLLLCSLAVIVYLLPKEAKFQYEFQQAKPWLHSDLLAPFDFAVLKTEKELSIERTSIESSVMYYFNYRGDIAEAQMIAFGQKVNSLPDSTQVQKERKTLIEKTGRSILDEIYRIGILKPNEQISWVADDQLITVVKNQRGEEMELRDLLTIAETYEVFTPRLKYLEEDLQKQLEDLLIEVVTHNVYYDSAKTNTILKERLDGVIPFHGKIEKDELIISKGQVVTPDIYQELVSLKKEYERRKGGDKNYWYILLGELLLVGLVIFVLVLFLSIFRQHIINVSNRVFFVLVSFTMTVAMGLIPIYFPEVPLYALPFCILPILIKTFYDEILAGIVHILAMLLIAFEAPNGFEFMYLQMIAGFIAVFGLVNIKKRSQLITTVVLIFLTYAGSDLAMLIVQEGDWRGLNYSNFYWFGSSAVLTLLAFPLIYLFEKAFGFLSDVTLMELADTNSPLLRRLATEAPGTFQHSMQVANLAEQAILKVGGNPLLVRTGAMYHDIGKMESPEFFIENQVGGHNPHDDLQPEESARIIIGHVIKGIELAKKHRLPEILIDFIRTHHGTSAVRYFLHKYKEEHGYDADVSQFYYPGPPPFSKETAVLMMADACEAASRSLKEYSNESIGNLVDNLIDHQASDGQFNNADITYKDISVIKKMFKKMLLNIYHVRIEYPK